MSHLNLAHVAGRCADGYAPIQHPRLCACSQVPALKANGIAAANTAPDAIKSRVDQAILRVARLGQEFSANDLRAELDGVPGPLVGARFNALGKQGLIVQTDRRVPSNKGNTHGHKIECWRGAA